MGRRIAESKLNKKLSKTVIITKQNTELPTVVKQNLDVLISTVRKEAHVGEETICRLVEKPEGMPSDTSRKNSSKKRMTEKDITQLTDAGNTAIQSTVGLLEAWSHLQTMRAKSAIAHKAYDEELAKLQDAFRRNLSDIDDKATVLRESIRRINTAENYDQLKEGLLSLAGKDEAFTEKDWQQFFEGKKTIVL